MNFSKVLDALRVARSNGLLWPKLRLPDRVMVKFTRRGDLVVIWRNTVCGRVSAGDTELRNYSGLPPERIKDLAALAENPIGAGKMFGLTTNICCFCGLQLTAAESVGNGYGPICAKKWGLPWADTQAARVERMLRLQQSLKEQEL